MSLTEADFVDGTLKSEPATKGGRKIQWQVWMQDKFSSPVWIDVAAADNWKMETSFAHGNKEVVSLSDTEDSWTIDFKTMSQINVKTLTRRAIRRVVILTDSMAEP